MKNFFKENKIIIYTLLLFAFAFFKWGFTSGKMDKNLGSPEVEIEKIK